VANRIVCIAEGKGEVEAVPNLCARILAYLGSHNWFVDSHVIRLPRSLLVDESTPSPDRSANVNGVQRAVSYAALRGADAMLILADADDDCAAAWSESIAGLRSPGPPVAAVMAVREFEAWLLSNRSTEELEQARIANPETVRDAKGRMRSFVAKYKPTVHQLEETRRIDIERVRTVSPSFDKLVRSIAILCNLADRRRTSDPSS